MSSSLLQIHRCLPQMGGVRRMTPLSTRRADCKMWEAEYSLAGTSSCLSLAQCPTRAMCAAESCQPGHTPKPLVALASLTSSLPVMLSKPYPSHLGPCGSLRVLGSVQRPRGWGVCQTLPQHPPPWCTFPSLMQYRWAKSSFEVRAHKKTAWGSAAF